MTLPVPSGRESVFELLCVVRLPGLTCLYQGWLGGERPDQFGFREETPGGGGRSDDRILE